MGGQLSEVKNWEKLPATTFKKIYNFKINLIKSILGGKDEMNEDKFVYKSQKEARIEFLRSTLSPEDFEKLDLEAV
ncbi:MAG: hypothetical protein ACTSQ8_07865 [Candidatus Helarchaeota archaeon]